MMWSAQPNFVSFRYQISMNAGDFSSAKQAMAPTQFELPFYQRVYISVMELGLTFGFAFIVLNCILSILIGVYGVLRKNYKLCSTDLQDNPFFTVPPNPLLCGFNPVLGDCNML